MPRKLFALPMAMVAFVSIATFGVATSIAAPRVIVAAPATSPLQLAAYDPLVYRAQVALTQRGFDAGAADGRLGPRTRAAIEAYQRAAGMAVTGRVDQGLVAQLERGGSVRADRSARQSRSANTAAARLPQPELIRQTQIELQRRGYDLTFIGGRLNGETSDAISDYQRSRGLAVTGTPSEELLIMLRQDKTGSRAIQPARPAESR